MSAHLERPTHPIIRCKGCLQFIDLTPPPDYVGVVPVGSYAICVCGTIIKLSEEVLARARAS